MYQLINPANNNNIDKNKTPIDETAKLFGNPWSRNNNVARIIMKIDKVPPLNNILLLKSFIPMISPSIVLFASISVKLYIAIMDSTLKLLRI